MLGWKLFSKSISQITNNLGSAIMISLLLWSVIFALGVQFQHSITGSIDPLVFQNDNLSSILKKPEFSFVITAINLIVKIIFGSLIAIKWHLFMLRGERPTSFLPTWDLKLLVAYIWKLLWLFLIYTPIALAFAAIIGLAIYMNERLATMFPILLMEVAGASVFTYFIMRISISLPATTIGKSYDVTTSWRMTRSCNLAIIIASLLLSTLAYMMNYGYGWIITGDYARLIASYVTGWISLMIGITILTTLYGYLEENRSLD